MKKLIGKKRLIVLSVIVVIVLVFFVGKFIDETEYVVPILMYHSIDYNFKGSKLSVAPESFAKQMAFLRSHNYNIVTLKKAVDYIKRREVPPPKTIAITFDDGFYNNYKYAYPVLKRYNIPATLFVIVNRVGSPGFLNWDEIREMSDSGLITIGSHTKTHFWLLGNDDRFLRDEVAGSKKAIEDKIGKPVEFLCYPMGSFDDKSRQAAIDAGYSCAVSTNPRGVEYSDIFAIKRVKISRSSDNIFIFWGETTRAYTWFKTNREIE